MREEGAGDGSATETIGTHPDRSTAVLVWMSVAAAVAVWSIGLGRAWEWDEAAAIESQIRAPSVKAALAAGGYTNHILMSVLETGLFRATGSTSELIARTVPVAFGAGTVALLAVAAHRRFGRAAAIGAVAVFVTNPLVFEQMRQIRGYAALTFFGFASTLLLLRLLRVGSWPRREVLLYAALLALGTASHLYMIGVFALHLAIVVGRNPHLVRRALPAWLLGGLAGLGANAFVLIRGNDQVANRTFIASFPVDLAGSILGSQPLAVIATALLLGLALPELLRRRDVQAALLMITALVLVEWLVLQPTFLYPRFFIWLAPMAALGVAWGIARAGRLPVPGLAVAALVIVAVAGQAASWLPHATQDHYANRAASDLVARAVPTGARACTQYHSRHMMRAYQELPEVTTDEELAACDLVIVLTENIDLATVRSSPLSRSADDIERVRRRFRERHELPAEVPGTVYTNAPASCVTDPVPSCWPSG